MLYKCNREGWNRNILLLELIKLRENYTFFRVIRLEEFDWVLILKDYNYIFYRLFVWVGI